MAVSELPDTSIQTARFPEYLKADQDFEGKDSPFDLLSPAEMKRLTAGGYQVFDTAVFPPVPIKGSIAERKLEDLQWADSDFAGMTVAEIGSQLGFFGFIAASLGARQVIGVDINPRFVAEANKFAVHFKRMCNWHDDKVMFRTQLIEVGVPLPEKPDIIVANSIVHWFIIQNANHSIDDILCWLRDNCNFAVYFEGCVTASEKIMQDHGIPLQRYSEERFLAACERLFSRVEIVGRCSYNNQRIVARLYK
ncbi:MAG: class I SAM-dependent methyltransferase [Haliea sp.]